MNDPRPRGHARLEGRTVADAALGESVASVRRRGAFPVLNEDIRLPYFFKLVWRGQPAYPALTVQRGFAVALFGVG